MQQLDRVWWRIVGCAVLALGVLGCTSVAPYRQVIVDDEKAGHFYPVVNCGVDGDRAVRLRDEPRAERRSCFSHSVERTDEYTLFFIEFDEQGRMYNRRQLKALVDYLMRLESRQRPPEALQPQCLSHNDGVSLVTFVHGWRHTARYDDDNVKLAREVLRATHLGETSGAHYNPAGCAREVVGVYVGWRGASLSVADVPSGKLRTLLGYFWEVPTVWDRKNTAQNVAVGSVRELFSLLKVYQDRRNEQGRDGCVRTSPPPGVTLADLQQVYQCMVVRHLIVGHSYGALIVHNAVAQQLLENVTRGALDRSGRDDPRACDAGTGSGLDGRALVRSYADLIVLLNPAVEGARYEPLYDATSVRAQLPDGTPGAFCPHQKPVMLVLTSQADNATRFLFRAVRLANTVMENNQPYDRDKSPTLRAYVASEEGRSSIRTLGHNDRYHTHELVSWERFVDLYADAPLPPADPKLVAEELPLHQMRQDYARQVRNACEAAPAQMRKALCPDATERTRSAFEDDVDNGTLQPVRQAFNAREASKGNLPPDNCTRSALADLHLARSLMRQREGQQPLRHGWSAGFLGGTVITHRPTYRPDADNFPPGTSLAEVNAIHEKHSPATPVWNIYVRDKTVMNDHGDISGDALVDLIKQMYRSVVVRSYDPALLMTLRKIAEAELVQCARRG